MLFAGLSFLGLMLLAVSAICADIERTSPQPAGAEAAHGHSSVVALRIFVLTGLVLAFVGLLAAVGSAR